MSLFGAHSPSDVAEAADKFISKMDEAQLSAMTAGHMSTMPVEGRRAFVESILDAFRHRGESSEDVAEAAHAGLEAMQGGDVTAISALLAYVDQNTGLLKEAATMLIEEHPEMVGHLPAAVVDGISSKLASR